jgi:hypothetical protein
MAAPVSVSSATGNKLPHAVSKTKTDRRDEQKPVHAKSYRCPRIKTEQPIGIFFKAPDDTRMAFFEFVVRLVLRQLSLIGASEQLSERRP